MRVHVFGASGSGTTTFGRGLASHWSIPHHDTDDYYWKKTLEPFTEKRPVEDRIQLMKASFLETPSWVLSGSLVSWSKTIIPYFDLAIFLSLDNSERLKRIKLREVARYGEGALAPNGNRYKAYQDFMEWNSGYENSNFKGRSRRLHEAWIKKLSCPVIRLDSKNTISELIRATELELS